jgi:putative ABC transport system permease protein
MNPYSLKTGQLTAEAVNSPLVTVGNRFSGKYVTEERRRRPILDMRALFDIFGQVFRSIGANKLRSFLTMFGIAWGVASLLLLIGLGEGFRSGQRRSLSELGTDVIMTWGGTIPAMPNQHTGMRPYKVTLSDAEAIRTEAPHVRNVTAFINRGDLKEVSEFSNVYK